MDLFSAPRINPAILLASVTIGVGSLLVLLLYLLWLLDECFPLESTPSSSKSSLFPDLTPSRLFSPKEGRFRLNPPHCAGRSSGSSPSIGLHLSRLRHTLTLPLSLPISEEFQPSVSPTSAPESSEYFALDNISPPLLRTNPYPIRV